MEILCQEQEVEESRKRNIKQSLSTVSQVQVHHRNHRSLNRFDILLFLILIISFTFVAYKGTVSVSIPKNIDWKFWIRKLDLFDHKQSKLFLFIDSTFKYKLVQVSWRSTHIMNWTVTKSRLRRTINRSSFESRQQSASPQTGLRQADSYSSILMHSEMLLRNMLNYSLAKSPARLHLSKRNLLQSHSKTKSLLKMMQICKKNPQQIHPQTHFKPTPTISTPSAERKKTVHQRSRISARIWMCSLLQTSQTPSNQTTKTTPTINNPTSTSNQTNLLQCKETCSSLPTRSKDRPSLTQLLLCAIPAVVAPSAEPTRTPRPEYNDTFFS